VVFGAALAVLSAGAFASSASAASASISVTRASGAALAENGAVRVGDSVHVTVSGFGANATVLYQFGPDALPTTTTTNAGGDGNATFVVPKLKSDVYVLTATSDTGIATFVVSVVNQATATTPAATPTATRTATATRTSTSTAHQRSATTPKSLAHTGGPQTLGLSLGAGALLAFGAAFLLVGAPVIRGRHERIRAAHAR
jgi:hypothetical protein